MLNKMDKFDIFVPHPLVITSLLPLECGCKPLVCLLKRPALLSLDFQDRSIRNYSCYIFGCENKTTMDTSEPYTTAMKDTMHKPQENLGVDQKFSPNRFPATRS
ncbi:hypothetical protein GmHk_07G019952 [Glycine max]|nr:hypothetical protein GmHk_07G019952 [Glycine max]